MNRNEALLRYQEEISSKSEQGKQKLLQQYTLNEAGFHKCIYECIKRLCKKITRPVSYFQISLLRCLIGGGTFRIMISAHDESYFLDPGRYEAFFDADPVFALLHNLQKELYDAAGDYHGFVQLFDAEQIIINTAMDFFKSQGGKLRDYFKDFDQWDCVRVLPFSPRLIVKWGEHREYSETVYLMDRREKTQVEFVEKNKNNCVQAWDSQYIYQGWDFTDFSGLTMNMKNVMFLNMRSCKLKDCRWETCLLLGAAFRESSLEKVVFLNCDLSMCDFRNTKLKQVEFIQCKLCSSDFTEAQMEEVAFTGSQMDDVHVSRQALACTGLDASQLQQLKVKEEPYVFHNGGRQADSKSYKV